MGEDQHIQPVPSMPDQPPAPDGTPPRPWESTDRAQAVADGALGPAPPAPPLCPDCGLKGDRYPTWTGAWILLEPVHPRETLPSHFVPPRQRWIIDGDGHAWNSHDAEPTPGAECRISHRIVCPGLDPSERDDLWPWLTSWREENARSARRKADGEGLPGMPDVG